MTLQPHDAHLEHDPSRVVGRLFLPGEGTLSSQSRIEQIAARVLSLSAEETARTASQVVDDFQLRHVDAVAALAADAEVVADRLVGEGALTGDQKIVLGSAFTAEFAVEGAALCNPSAVVHPSQHGLGDDELRVAVSLRCIGEGHISSIGFAEAIIGADDSWRFAERATPLARPVIDAGQWSREHFRRTLADAGGLGDLASAVIGALPDRFDSGDMERAIAALPHQLSMRPHSRAALQKLRDVCATAYRAEFSDRSALGARVLMPVTADEDRGVEDARFVRFTDADGTIAYRATYTAYDGERIAPRLITSPDLRSFDFHRLTGAGARNKGMALFPRRVGGRHLALSRTDGENITLAGSEDGLVWDDLGMVYGPQEIWEAVQLGNCGSPIETPDGWVVLIHGVGPLRTYSLGALLLDLDDPTQVLARTTAPLLRPEGDLIDGYVPRVVYSCGAIAHRDTLWIPVGVGDARIRVYSISLSQLRDEMTPTA